MKVEKEKEERIIYENEHFLNVIPFWAIWPFETLIISKNHHQDIRGFSEEEKDSFAEMLKKITSCYDRLFNVSFPYSAGIHQAPTDGQNHPEWHFHFHFLSSFVKIRHCKKIYGRI